MVLGPAHWISFRDCSVFVQELVSARPALGSVLFLHGRHCPNEENLLWGRVTERLSSTFRCVLPDLPGFGRSACSEGRAFSLDEQAHFAADSLARFSVRGRPRIIVSHDLGCVVAQRLAVLWPEVARCQVFVNPVSALSEFPDEFRPSIRQWFRSLLEGYADHKRMSEVMSGFQDGWPDPVKQQHWRAAMMNSPQAVLVLRGAHDPAGNRQDSFDIVRSFSDSRFFESDQSGPWPCLEDPDWVSSKILEFLFRILESEAESQQRSTRFSRARKSPSR